MGNDIEKRYLEYHWDYRDFRVPSGHYRTNSLFVEHWNNKFEPILTLKETDVNGCPSLRQIYLAHEDPTEYYFAKSVFGSWDYWKELRGCELLRAEVEKWRSELEVKLRAKAFVKIMETANDKHSKFAYDANKMIVKEGWKLPESSAATRGRPSKKEVSEELAKQAALEKQILENAKRAGIVVEMDKAVNG